MLHKILFAGPVGAGKTTAIAAVSDSGVMQTDTRATDGVVERKDHTTVAMDYGTLEIDSDLTIQLVGTPGQERFDFMWTILARGAIGVAILIDHCRPDSVQDLHVYLDAFEQLIRQEGGAGVIGVTRTDLSDNAVLDQYRDVLNERDLRLPVLEVDARSRIDVKVMLMALTAELNPRSRNKMR